MVLVNPNTSTATTAMMAAIARRSLGPALPVRGVTVARGPRMLTDPDALRAAAPEVLAAGLRATAGGDCVALLVAAFGDPGLAELRAATSTTSTAGATSTASTASTTSTARAAGEAGEAGAPGPVGTAGGTGAAGAAGVRAAGFPVVGATGVPAAGVPAAGIPVVGIGEAALLEAAAAGTPFGIATTTPLLADAIHARVTALGLADLCTGIRLTAGDPERLSADPVLLLDRLERAVRAGAERDGPAPSSSAAARSARRPRSSRPAARSGSSPRSRRPAARSPAC
ncbi:aspartate/glutamate racemase family protein [Streptomyces vietnamensis]|uniref:aspartate/glutamate racemase family protein n=1 Tax=Streptomyces vietnamensis TaxID=362257 RepID=UPI0034274BA0